MKSKVLFLFIMVTSLIGCNTYDEKSEVNAIKEVMYQQQLAWNKGDLEGFMQGYWKNDSLVFIGSKGLTYGWQTTLENYQKGYPTPEKMGELTFTLKHVKVLSPFEAFVIGKWELTRPGDHPKGHYTILWKKFNGEWKIVADHSS